MIVVAAAASLAGLVHVVSGPDHLAAIAPFVVQGGRGLWRLGLRWGLGHAAGTGLVGVAAIAARGALPLETLGVWSERLVGVVLVGVGLWAVGSLVRNRVHSHPHVHGEGIEHAHVHAHPGGSAQHAHAHAAVPHHRHGHSALGIGLLHGVAGGSHLIGVLPALALGTTGGAALYVTAFAGGGVLGMTAWAAAMGWVGRRAADLGLAHQALGWGSALAAIGLGLFWIGGGAA